MGIITTLFGREERADGMVAFDDALLQALLGKEKVKKDIALQVPTISGGIDLIANIIASTPIKMYRDRDGKAEEIKDDARVRLLNDETGDTLNANEFWHAMIRDYYTGRGGYAYIAKSRGQIKSIHYVDEAAVSINANADPIFKDFDIVVNGGTYRPFNFFKILRNTKNGATGTPITEENSKLIAAAYASIVLEYSMAQRGGNKKGFFKSPKRIDRPGMDELKSAYKELYTDGTNNAMVLNNGLEFQEASDTAAEMQLNENKTANAEEFAKIFHISPDAISGKNADIGALAKLAAIPLMAVIQCAANRDLLLEREKGDFYWAFDTKELLKGEMKERYAAYKTALDANFMQIDEVRYAEDMPPLGLSWIKLGLQDVLYDPATKTIYTPNTNQTSRMSEKTLNSAGEDGILSEKTLDEQRAKNNYIQAAGGKMNGSRPSGGGTGGRGGKTKYAPSPQANKGGIKVAPKTFGILRGQFNTKYPKATPADGQKSLYYKNSIYRASADGAGSIKVHSRAKIKVR
ncbi:MAG: phage portal protein [Oscillospiraceae bacterium]|nr:phage portal protein [Oscillospiraceae bacterium]